MPKTELTNMCMIYDRTTDRILVQDRVLSWKGISFPGGHVDEGEGIVDSTIREIKEETGLDIEDLEMCGVIYWYNDDTGDKYFVFNFRTETFSGELLDSTVEGRVFWVDRAALSGMTLSPGLVERLPMFLEGKYSEGFGIWSERKKSQLTFK